MSKNETLHIRVNDSVKHKAEETLNQLGISIAEAVNLLLHQIILTGGIPFELKLPNQNTEKPQGASGGGGFARCDERPKALPLEPATL